MKDYNGTVNAMGAIHRIDAKAANTPICNGWIFGRVKINGGQILLNQLRGK